jgi:hypothetical protein
MIVRDQGSSVLLVTQPDHAQLAGRIMERCVQLRNRPRRESILHAIAEHDNGWTEEDASPALDPTTGRVVDFVTAPLAVRHRVWPRGVERLAADPWAAALVGQHAITVYDRFRPDPDWAAFFASMERLRDEMVARSGLPLAALLEDYVFVRLGDLISLTFCTGWTDEQRFASWAVRRHGDTVVVTHDPFDGVPVPVEVRARRLPSEPLRSDAELRGALAAAEPVTLRGTVQGIATGETPKKPG